MCNLYSITTNQAAIIALFRVVNRYVGNLPPMPGVFPDYPAPVIRNTDQGTELVTMRWGASATANRRSPCDQHSQHIVIALARVVEAREPLLGASKQFR
jgi:putative SOS response-associated peptidase YedK